MKSIKPKPFPTDDIDNLLPPVFEYSCLSGGNKIEIVYEYFEDGIDHPFDTFSGRYSLRNAWWLGDAAMLAYSDPDVIRTCCGNAGFTNVQWFSGLTTQCYVAARKEYVFVVFRGTQAPCRNQPVSDVVVDWITDFRMRLVEFDGEGRIHEGFHSALAEVWDPLAAALQALREEDPARGVWFTGHSLGAALATVAAAKDGKPAGQYTFGSPIVGDAAFQQWFQFKFPTGAWRFVNDMDIIARLPFCGLYHPVQVPSIGHYQPVGELRFIDADGQIGTVETASAPWGSPTSPTPPQASALYEYVRDHFADHAPLRYQIRIWNQYVSEVIGQSTAP